MVKGNIKIFLSIFVAVTILIAGCNKVKQLLDVKFDANFIVNLAVEAEDYGLDGGFFSIEKVVDPLADEEVKKYIDNIKGLEVTGLSMIFKQVNPGFNLSEGIAKMSLDNWEVTWNLKDQLVTDGTEVALGNENGQWNMVNDIMNQKKEFLIIVSGKSEPASSFVIQIDIKTKITANAL